MRRYVRPEVNAEDRDIVEREARILQHVQNIFGVPTPR
jgi:hypothetical protein